MTDNLDKLVGRAMREIEPDPEAPARTVTALADVRRPRRMHVAAWMSGGAVAGVAGFALARLQGPVSGVDTGVFGDTTLFLLASAL